LLAQAVPQLIIANRARQEPGGSRVKWPSLEFDIIESDFTFGLAKYLQTQAVAEITRRAYLRTTVTHGIKKTILLA
jgi:hypothetical protein